MRSLFFLSLGDPEDVGVFSGSSHYLLRALQRAYPGIQTIAEPIPYWFRTIQRIIRRIPIVGSDIGGRRLPMRHFATALRKRLPSDALVIGLNNSPLLALLAELVPVIYVSDATFAVIDGFYDFGHVVRDAERRSFHDAERRAINLACHASFSSQWAADSAIRDYGADAAKVSVVSWGCNLPAVPSPATMHPMGSVCRLLLPGRDWFRKGADVAIETLDHLALLGLAATLDIVGMDPPSGYSARADVNIHPLLRKNIPEEASQLDGLFERADFLFLPSRADCTPMVFAEANAFGLPVVTVEVGGVASVVRHGENGLVAQPQDGPAGLARIIAETFANPARYDLMRTTARRHYEDRLNWDQWVKAMAPVIERERRSR